LEELNESLRNRDKMKDDAITQLSDQLMALTTRMYIIKITNSCYGKRCMIELNDPILPSWLNPIMSTSGMLKY